jgi:hypothetical protein
VPALIVRFPDGSREFRYPDRPVDVGDAIWHDNVRYHIVAVTEDGGGEQLTVTVEPNPESIGDLLGSEEGALVLVPAT